MHSFTEENYLKAIYSLNEKLEKGATTTALAKKLSTKASSITDMMQKLADKKLVHYKKYQGVTLTEFGEEVAVNIIRKHRLWEVLLVKKLNFKWDEVHELAEQLEHINSDELTDRLDKFLGHPTADPHGDPIPDRNGKITEQLESTLDDLNKGDSAVIIGVKDSSTTFLQYLEKTKLVLGTKIMIIDVFEYDKSMTVKLNGRSEITISDQVCKNLYVKHSD